MDEKTKKTFKTMFYITPIIGVLIGFYHVTSNKDSFSQKDKAIVLIENLKKDVKEVSEERDKLIKQSKEKDTKIRMYKGKISDFQNELKLVANNLEKNTLTYKNKISKKEKTIENQKLIIKEKTEMVTTKSREVENLKERVTNLNKKIEEYSQEDKLIQEADSEYPIIIIIHKVEAGESLGKITDFYNRKYKTNCLSVENVAEFNGLEAPSYLKIDQKIKLKITK